MIQIPEALIKKIFDYLNWGAECLSFNEEITLYSEAVKYETKYLRLLRYIEIWWRKSKYQIKLRNIWRALEKHPEYHSGEITVNMLALNSLLHDAVDEEWSDREWKLSEQEIHGEKQGKIWYL